MPLSSLEVQCCFCLWIHTYSKNCRESGKNTKFCIVVSFREGKKECDIRRVQGSFNLSVMWCNVLFFFACIAECYGLIKFVCILLFIILTWSFLFEINLFIFIDFEEREREKEKQMDVSDRHQWVVSRLCPDWGLNPNSLPFGLRDHTPTNEAVRPGRNLYSSKCLK